MTPYEFKKSLTPEQKQYYEAEIRESFNREERYYRECVRLQKEITLLLYAMNVSPLGTTDQLCKLMQAARNSLAGEKG
jgi:hypothetical protein